MQFGLWKNLTLLVAVLALMACGNSQEEARIKLGQMNVNYNEDTFVDRAKDGDFLAVKLFLQAGMSPSVRDKDGVTPLMAAARGGRLKVMQLLLGKGADVNAKDEKFGATPLIWAALGGNTDIVKVLLEKGADPKATDSEGRTALMWAARSGNVELAQVLLDKGAEVNAKDQKGNTALTYAKQAKKKGIEEMLLKAGAAPEKDQSPGKTRAGPRVQPRPKRRTPPPLNQRQGKGHSEFEESGFPGQGPRHLAGHFFFLKAGAKNTQGRSAVLRPCSRTPAPEVVGPPSTSFRPKLPGNPGTGRKKKSRGVTAAPRVRCRSPFRPALPPD